MRLFRILALVALAGCASANNDSGSGVNWNRVSNVATGTAIIVTVGVLASL